MIIRRNESLKLKCPANGYPIPITRWLEILIKILMNIFFLNFHIGIKMKSNYMDSIKNYSYHLLIDKMLDFIHVLFRIILEQIDDILILLYPVNKNICMIIL
jgi:hypothetical protein